MDSDSEDSDDSDDLSPKKAKEALQQQQNSPYYVRLQKQTLTHLQKKGSKTSRKEASPDKVKALASPEKTPTNKFD